MCAHEVAATRPGLCQLRPLSIGYRYALSDLRQCGIRPDAFRGGPLMTLSSESTSCVGRRARDAGCLTSGWYNRALTYNQDTDRSLR